MLIGIDGQKLLIEELAGPEVYTVNTVKALAKIDADNKYIIYLDKHPTDKFWEDLTQNNPNFDYKVVTKTISWTQFDLPLQLLRDKPNIFFNAKHTIPFFKPLKTKLISMIHGLEFASNKQFHKNPIKHLIHPIILWVVLLCSKAIIVPSNATKNAIINKNWPFIKKNKFNVIPEGVNDQFYKRTTKDIQEVREKFKIGDNPYLLFVSTIQPRKNIPLMIKAFSKVVQNYQTYKDLKLLISGKLGWLYQESLMAPSKYDIAENIRFLGRTSDEDLPKLLSGSTAFINCSIEEGFGIPLLEAMACEIPTIVSNIDAFIELGRDTPVYVDPNDADQIEQGILECLNKKHDVSVKQAKEIAKEYTWEKSSRAILALFENNR